MNIAEFLEKFNQNYDLLYTYGDNVAGYHQALEFGDEIIQTEPEFVQEFVQYRGDVLSSDREVAVFGFTLSDFGY